jgi:transposase
MEDHNNYGPWLKAIAAADEVQARRFAAAKALELGWGGISKVSELTGMSMDTIRKGISELESDDVLERPQRLREPGAGRKKVEDKDPKAIEDIERIMGESTAGDPMSLLKWTHKSTYSIVDALKKLGHKISPNTVGRLLKEREYSLQANVKSKEWGAGPERDAQFRHINETAKDFMARGEPAISVDTKKKERVGDFKNNGRTWTKKGQPREVNVYDFPSLAIGTAIPYGVYDVAENEGVVNVGMSHDTSEFAVESIRQWWFMLGRHRYPNAKELLICADGGGSNGSRNRSWKFFLQELADLIGLSITVRHYPPGTSKWNKIEHRMFSFISMNWKGKPLVTYEIIVKLIGETKTSKGLKVTARLDDKEYKKGIKITDDDMSRINIRPDQIHPKWNYSISPRDIYRANG